MKTLILLSLAAGLTSCAPYEPEPTSPIQWERRQEAILRQEAERRRQCAALRAEDPRRAELCRGVTGETRP